MKAADTTSFGQPSRYGDHAAPPSRKARKRFGLRTWSTPLTIGSFVLMAVTGVMMFFDVAPGYVSFAHEWASWFFLVGTAGHVAVNFRPLRRHLRSNWGRANVVIFSTALVVSMFSFGRITAPQLKWPISNALVQAPLSALADLTHTGPAELVARLEQHGLSATPEQNIMHLADKHDMDEFHILGLVFLRE